MIGAAALAVGLATAGPAGARVDDPTGCVDAAALDLALSAVAGAERLPVEVAVLPEGELRAVRLAWADGTRRELEVTAGDCPRLPEMIALATERVLAALPGGLEPPTGRWTGAAGGALGVGATPWAPWVEVWLGAAPDRAVAVDLAVAAVGTGQALGAGGVAAGGLDLRVGASAIVGPSRLGAALVGGGRLGAGVGLADGRAALLPRSAVRVWAASRGSWRATGAVEVPWLAPAWRVAGGPVAREPWVTASVGIGHTFGGQ